ncbi:winged helix-turn-helix domain-containing protein [Pseudoclavibacter chungangensis]|uniref:Winged helix-turn-helix domain-containing protein n=1 Tax=Pseudoclavibacter chungangensis TaxID=587635 RepID=A0A7J5C2V9_9MICO|nr:winged helix-turn-helix domain-containing protein [Pseudoclavibacter chungangensis]KAB1662532.1 winged helix-turn-helix domain-containing protein [Pseudoclavibacter chungangensis]NYJ68571.1 DNA-binding response OmpR family regulator [Pseudoclavibacter chungangensis]
MGRARPDTVRVVDTTIQRLRAKLDESGVGTPTLETMRGIGYRLR